MTNPEPKNTASPQESVYARGTWRAEILRQTPPDVWRQYAADGVSQIDAITEEESYAR